MAAQFRIEGAAALESLARDLKSVADAKELRKDLSRRLTNAVKPIVPDIRTAVKSIPSKGATGSGHSARSAMFKRGGSGSLRDHIARAVQAKTSVSGQNVGVRIRIDASKMPDDQRGLPKLMEGPGKWRHPVYGNHDTWVTQKSHPYFFRSIQPHLSRVETEVVEVMTDVSRRAGFN